MEVKDWSYEEIPEWTEPVEGVTRLGTSGEEIGVRYLADVEYAVMDGIHLHLQIMQPFSRNRQLMVCPCMVFVQGSAWFEQNVYMEVPQLAKLAARGYVTAIVQYRHSMQANFPAQILDTANAIRFLRVHADEYGIDPERIFISGSSSGGHTAMFVGMPELVEKFTTDPSLNLYPGVNAKVRGILNYYGSCSVMSPDSNPTTVNHCLADSPEGWEMGHVDLTEEMKRQLSVECNITPETTVAPAIIYHGTKDRIVNCECSVKLYRKLKECGKEVTLYLIEGADHGGSEFWSDEVISLSDQFMKSH